MFAELEIRYVVSSEHQSPQPWTLTIYRGFGGDHIVIDPVETVYGLLNTVDQRTDWLWGFCSPHAIRKSYSDDFLPWDHLLFWIRDMDSGEILALNCGLSITTSSNIQIVYRPLRITREGFPCFNCMEFVFWKSPCWFTISSQVSWVLHCSRKGLDESFTCHRLCSNSLASPRLFLWGMWPMYRWRVLWWASRNC